MQSYAERMEMIRAAREKIFGNGATRKVTAGRERKPRDDERYWTDSRQYANEYYGEAYRATTRYDNEWD